VIDKQNEKIIFFEGIMTDKALICIMQAFPAELDFGNQCRCPQGGSTGCWAMLLQALQM